MKILVDFREGRVAKMIQGVCDEIEFVHLPLGDYLIPSKNGSVVVERKTARDFLSSVRSNRLWEQLLRLMRQEEVLGFGIKRRILLIHGSIGELMEIAGYAEEYLGRDLLVFWSQIMGAFLEILYVYDTPIVLAENDVALRAFFRILVKREMEGLNDKLPTARWYRKRVATDLPIKDRKLYLLSSLPLIGQRLGRNLLEHFGTISEVANATVKELQRVPKIGRKKAENIYKIFHS